MAVDHHNIGDDDVAAMRRLFTDAEFLELSMMISPAADVSADSFTDFDSFLINKLIEQTQDHRDE
jgi:hypothetical protein